MQYHCLHVTGIMSPLIMSDVGLMLMWTSYFLDNMYFIASRCRKFFCSYPPSVHVQTFSTVSPYCSIALIYSDQILLHLVTPSAHLEIFNSTTSSSASCDFFKISATIMKSFITAGLISVVYLLTWLKLDLKLRGGRREGGE